jgi:hypothetical protein
MLENHLQQFDNEIAANARALADATDDEKPRTLGRLATAAVIRERERKTPPWTRKRH